MFRYKSSSYLSRYKNIWPCEIHEGHGTQLVIYLTCCIIEQAHLDGATPIRFGPIPFHNALPPSVSTIWRINLKMKNPPRGLEGEIVVVVVAVDIGVDGHNLVEAGSEKLKFTTEDCKRVLTTSSGQVTMAPIVPPALKHNEMNYNSSS